MSQKIKACYKCGSAEHVELESRMHTAKYKGKLVTYRHEESFCTKCKRYYEHEPVQTDANKKRLHAAWLQLSGQE